VYGPAAALAPLLPTCSPRGGAGAAAPHVTARVAAAATAAAIPSKGENVVLLARQGLTLVHFSAQLERCVWDGGCA
jgi:hypothetical protein